jgi:hypothetical protein
MTKSRKFPQIRIRPSGDRFAVRWQTAAGKPVHRAVVATNEIAIAIRDAVRAGHDGWSVLADTVHTYTHATIEVKEPDAGNPDRTAALASVDAAVSSGLVTWPDVVAAVDRVVVTRQERLDRVRERVASGRVVQAIDPATASARAAKGGAARAANMTPERRAEIARKAALTRHAKNAKAHEVSPGPDVPSGV